MGPEGIGRLGRFFRLWVRRFVPMDMTICPIAPGGNSHFGDWRSFLVMAQRVRAITAVAAPIRQHEKPLNTRASASLGVIANLGAITSLEAIASLEAVASLGMLIASFRPGFR